MTMSMWLLFISSSYFFAWHIMVVMQFNNFLKTFIIRCSNLMSGLFGHLVPAGMLSRPLIPLSTVKRLHFSFLWVQFISSACIMFFFSSFFCCLFTSLGPWCFFTIVSESFCTFNYTRVSAFLCYSISRWVLEGAWRFTACCSGWCATPWRGWYCAFCMEKSLVAVWQVQWFTAELILMQNTLTLVWSYETACNKRHQAHIIFHTCNAKKVDLSSIFDIFVSLEGP